MIEEKDIDIIIPSKGRPETVKRMLELFPKGRYCISESDVDKYKIKNNSNLLIHPDTLIGLIPKRQWILDNNDKRCIFQTDDDIQKVVCLVGKKARIIDNPYDIMQIIVNSANICDGLGIKLFGYTLVDYTLYSRDNKPIKFCTIIAGAYGIIDRYIYYDHNLRSREDADITLMGLKNYRINWIDTRFCFDGPNWDNKGGLQMMRTKMSEDKDIQYMKNKWGKYIDWEERISKGDGLKSSQRNKLVIKVRRK